eukprot:scaffold184_cov316-Pinguiococcus_pyrenoidosus.AAC.52
MKRRAEGSRKHEKKRLPAQLANLSRSLGVCPRGCSSKPCLSVVRFRSTAKTTDDGGTAQPDSTCLCTRSSGTVDGHEAQMASVSVRSLCRLPAQLPRSVGLSATESPARPSNVRVREQKVRFEGSLPSSKCCFSVVLSFRKDAEGLLDTVEKGLEDIMDKNKEFMLVRSPGRLDITTDAATEAGYSLVVDEGNEVLNFMSPVSGGFQYKLNAVGRRTSKDDGLFAYS